MPHNPLTIQAATALLLFTLIAPTAFAEAPATPDTNTIRTLRAQSNEAIARHDAQALRSFLHNDYVITVSTGFIERSADGHANSLAQHFAEFPDVLYVRTPTSVTISSAYPLAMEQGTWVGTRTTANGPLESGGQYTAAWRKTSTGWKIYSELFVALYCEGVDC